MNETSVLTDNLILCLQPVYHEPYGARSPTTREAATLQIAVGRKGKTTENKPFQSMRGKEEKREKRPIANFSLTRKLRQSSNSAVGGGSGFQTGCGLSDR